MSLEEEAVIHDLDWPTDVKASAERSRNVIKFNSSTYTYVTPPLFTYIISRYSSPISRPFLPLLALLVVVNLRYGLMWLGCNY